MKLKQAASAVAVTTLPFAPSYINQITPQVTLQVNENITFNNTDINLVEIEKAKIHDLIKEVVDKQGFSIKLNKYADDANYTYVSFYSDKFSFDQLFDIEEELNDHANRTNSKLIFTVGE
ncbi:hypothetical protein [Facklamia sp. P12955]|uniref:hypothetical protein n=1 Tax=unclassified Facklamia TaxID=2622293 RepID=UPI003D174546